MTPKTYTREDDTIDLRELFLTLKKRKKLIISIVTTFTLLATLYAFFIAKPIYAVKAVIEIGMIEDEPIDDINNVQQKLSYIYKVNTTGIKRKLPLVKSISIDKKSKSLIFLVIHGRNNKEAMNYIQSVITKIEKEYQEKTDAYIIGQQELIALIQLNIQDNNASLSKMKRQLIQHNTKIIALKSEDAALAGIYALQIGSEQTIFQELKKDISELKNKKLKIKRSLSPVMMKPTQIVGDIEVLEKPIKPKKIMIIMMTVIVSFLFSILFALTLDLFKRKEET